MFYIFILALETVTLPPHEPPQHFFRILGSEMYRTSARIILFNQNREWVKHNLLFIVKDFLNGQFGNLKFAKVKTVT